MRAQMDELQRKLKEANEIAESRAEELRKLWEEAEDLDGQLQVAAAPALAPSSAASPHASTHLRVPSRAPAGGADVRQGSGRPQQGRLAQTGERRRHEKREGRHEGPHRGAQGGPVRWAPLSSFPMAILSRPPLLAWPHPCLRDLPPTPPQARSHLPPAVAMASSQELSRRLEAKAEEAARRSEELAAAHSAASDLRRALAEYERETEEALARARRSSLELGGMRAELLAVQERVAEERRLREDAEGREEELRAELERERQGAAERAWAAAGDARAALEEAVFRAEELQGRVKAAEAAALETDARLRAELDAAGEGASPPADPPDAPIRRRSRSPQRPGMAPARETGRLGGPSRPQRPRRGAWRGSSRRRGRRGLGCSGKWRRRESRRRRRTSSSARRGRRRKLRERSSGS